MLPASSRGAASRPDCHDSAWIRPSLLVVRGMRHIPSLAEVDRVLSDLNRGLLHPPFERSGALPIVRCKGHDQPPPIPAVQQEFRPPPPQSRQRFCHDDDRNRPLRSRPRQRETQCEERRRCIARRPACICRCDQAARGFMVASYEFRGEAVEVVCVRLRHSNRNQQDRRTERQSLFASAHPSPNRCGRRRVRRRRKGCLGRPFDEVHVHGLDPRARSTRYARGIPQFRRPRHTDTYAPRDGRAFHPEPDSVAAL